MKINKHIMSLLGALAFVGVTCPISAQAALITVTGDADGVLYKTYNTAAPTVRDNATGTPAGQMPAIAPKQDGASVTKIVNTIETGTDTKQFIAGAHLQPAYENYANFTADTLSGGVETTVNDGTISDVLYGGNVIAKVITGKSMAETAEILGDKVNVGSVKIVVNGGTIGTENGSSEAIMGGGGRHCGTADSGHAFYGTNPGRLGGSISAGVIYRLNDAWNLRGNYSIDMADDSVEQNVNIGASYTF